LRKGKIGMAAGREQNVLGEEQNSLYSSILAHNLIFFDKFIKGFHRNIGNFTAVFVELCGLFLGLKLARDRVILLFS